MEEHGREKVGKREELRPFESLLVGHFFLDDQFRVMEISEESARLLNSIPADIISKKLGADFGPPDAIFRESLEGRTQLSEFRLPDGNTCNACVRVKQRADAGGKGFDVVFCIEAPEFKCFNGESVHYREVLGKCSVSEKHSAFLENILAGVGHDLKTPLGVVLGYCELISKSKTSGTQIDIEKSLNNIYRNCGWMADMVEKLEEFSGIVNRGKSEKAELVELKEELEAAVRRLSKAAFGRQVRLEVKRSDRASVLGSPSLLSAIINELVKNAVFYCRKGREVSLSLVNPGGSVRLSLEVPALEDEVPPLSHLADKLFPHSPDLRKEEGHQKPFCLGLGAVKHLALITGASLTVAKQGPEGETLLLEFEEFRE